MTTEADDPIFPTSHTAASNRGITKREFFAAIAIASVLIKEKTEGEDLIYQEIAQEMATWAVDIADYLISELNIRDAGE